MRHYIPGIFLIMSGVIIAAFPEILVAFIAGAIILAGVAALGMGHVVGKSQRQFQDAESAERFGDGDHWRVIRIPRARNWRGWFRK